MQSETYNNWFLGLAQWCIVILGFLLPFWFLPTTLAPVAFNKILMVSLLTIAAFVLYLVHAIMRARISVGVHWIFLFLGGTVVFWFFSALFSDAGPIAWWGMSAETSSFFSILIFAVLTWLVAMLFSDYDSLKKLLWGVVYGFSIFSIISLLSILGAGQWLGGVFANSFFNTIGSWNGIALASGFAVMALFPFLLGSSGKRRWMLAGPFALFLFIIALIDFPLAWVFLGIFSLTFLSYAIWQRTIQSSALLATIILLSVSIFGFSFRGVVSSIAGVEAPVEVSVSHRATAHVVADSLRENIIFGEGPATFRFLWDKFKAQDVNNSIFWSVRFDAGSSFLLSVLGEVGLFGWLAFIGFLGTLWYLGLIMVTRRKHDALVLSSFFMLTYTILMWALYPVGFTLVALGFLSAGFMLALLRTTGIIKVYDILLFGEGPLGFVSAMIIVFFMISGLAGFYVIGSRYAGQLLFKSGIDAFNQNSDMDRAEQKIVSAIRIDGKKSAYYAALAQLYTLRSQLVLQDRTTTQELLSSQFRDFLDRALNSSQSAVRIAPLDFVTYRSLGKIYEFLITLGTDGARDAALIQYDAALEHSPKNPALYHDKALAYLSDAVARNQRDQLNDAERELLKAVELKPDYAAGHFILAQVLDAKGDSPEAIRRGEAAAILSPNDVGALFQLGLLYYKENRLSDSEMVFRRVVSINPNYSNARYFLGLIFDRTKRSEDAITEFERIAELNRGNAEVEQILYNLREGKSALDGISPPALSPDKRREAPVDEAIDAPSLQR